MVCGRQENKCVPTRCVAYSEQISARWKANVRDSKGGFVAIDRHRSALVRREPELGKCHAAGNGFRGERRDRFVLGAWKRNRFVQTFYLPATEDGLRWLP